MSDLEDMISAAGGSPDDADASSHEDLLQLVDAGDPGGTPVPMTPESPVSPELAALLDMVETALTEPSPKRYKSRSWEHAAHARDVHIANHAAAMVLRQEEHKGDILEIVAKVMYRVPGVQTWLWKLRARGK